MDKVLYGLQVAGIGLVVVFAGLAILIGCILLMALVFKAINARKDAKEKAAAAAAAAAAPAPAPEPVKVSEADAGEEVNDAELIAVIAAAIAAFDNSGKSLVVRKVRRVPGWNRASRAEQVYRF